MTALCITQCSNLSFCLLFLSCLCLSNYLFFHFCFVFIQLYSIFLFLIRALSLTLVAQRGSSMCFSPNCQLSNYTFIDHVSSPKLTVSFSFNCLCFVKWVAAFNCKMINNETYRNALSALQRHLKVEKNFLFIATEDRSQDLIFDSPLYYPLF